MVVGTWQLTRKPARAIDLGGKQNALDVAFGCEHYKRTRMGEQKMSPLRSSRSSSTLSATPDLGGSAMKTSLRKIIVVPAAVIGLGTVASPASASGGAVLNHIWSGYTIGFVNPDPQNYPLAVRDLEGPGGGQLLGRTARRGRGDLGWPGRDQQQRPRADRDRRQVRIGHWPVLLRRVPAGSLPVVPDLSVHHPVPGLTG